MSRSFSELPLTIKLFLVPTAWGLARLPQWARQGLAHLLGGIIYYGFKKRRRILLANLHHAYPDWEESRRRRVGRRSCDGVVEMGLLALSAPFFSVSWLHRHFRFTERMEQYLERQRKEPRPALYLVPHQALFESVLWACRGRTIPELGVLYRPPNQKSFAAFLEWSRARTGITMLSKKEGLAQSLGFLRKKGNLAILFDQNAGPPGAGVLFLDQVCSATDLPGTFARKFDTEVLMFSMRRIRGWEVELDLEPLETEKTPEAVTVNSNRWLSDRLWNTHNIQDCADYMWLHNRWKFQWDVRQCLSISFKKSYLPEDLPRLKRFYIRLPDQLDVVEELVAFLKQVRRSRPDAAITLFAEQVMIQENLPSLHEVSEKQIALPEGADRAFFEEFQKDYPDTFLNLSEDPQTDQHAVWMDIPVRLGWTFPDQRRPHLTHPYPIEDRERWEQMGNLERWLTFGRHFGLNTSEDPPA